MRIIVNLIAGFTLLFALVMKVQADEQSAVDNSINDSKDSASVDDSYAEQLYIGRCVTCHQLPDPGMLNMKQWRLVLATMQLRMQQFGLPPLTEDETAIIMDYLAARARE